MPATHAFATVRTYVLTQRYVDQGSDTTLGPAAEAAVKAAKYADQDNFIPFILETGEHVNKAARGWLDTLKAPESGEKVHDRPGNPHMQTTAESVQAHMLARIVVEIRSTDLAVEWKRSIP